MDCSMPGLSVLHYLLEFAQVHVHCISDSIQPSHPLMSSSSSALNLSQHQGLFLWVNCLPQVTKILELQLQHQSFQWVFRVNFLSDWLVWSPCWPRDSKELSPAPQFKGINSLVVTHADLWRGAWQPTPVFLPGESHGQRSLGGYSPWGRKVSHDWAPKHSTAHRRLIHYVLSVLTEKNSVLRMDFYIVKS